MPRLWRNAATETRSLLRLLFLWLGGLPADPTHPVVLSAANSSQRCPFAQLVRGSSALPGVSASQPPPPQPPSSRTSSSASAARGRPEAAAQPKELLATKLSFDAVPGDQTARMGDRGASTSLSP